MEGSSNFEILYTASFRDCEFRGTTFSHSGASVAPLARSQTSVVSLQGFSRARGQGLLLFPFSVHSHPAPLLQCPSFDLAAAGR